MGVPNPNILVPVQKMRITNLDAKSPPKSIEVLYNPQSYTRKKVVNVLVHALLALLAIIWLLPIAWIVLTSFRAEPGAYTNTVLPQGYTLDNYAKLLTDRNVLDFPRMFSNTLIISIISTFLVLSVSFSLSRLRFRLRKPYMNMAMVLGLFPGFMTMVAQYFILKSMGLTEGSYIRIGLIVVYSACAGLGFQITKGFFDTIPRSVDEAAIMDGATEWQVFTRITLPLSKPIVIYTILMAFMAPWGDYVFASYVAFGSEPNYNVAVGLYRWVNVADYQGYFTRFCAGGVLVAVPITILFMCLQKYYVEGVTGGAVKG